MMEVCEQVIPGLAEKGVSTPPNCPPIPPLLNGYRLEMDQDHLDNMLIFDLQNSQHWKKRVYPRMGHHHTLNRWCTVEEILSFMISFQSHPSWITEDVPQKPVSGTILFYDRSKTKKYRNDGYDWKKRKGQSTIVREDRMRLKVGRYQLLYGCYAHSSSQPILHRRTYWLINNPNIIMVHYLKVGSSNSKLRKSVLEEGSLEPIDTPLDWSILTISDCNLCALLDMVNDDISTENLLSQLSLILTNNLHHATSLADALALNNEGLPFDMYLDTRAKKTRNELPSLAPSLETPSINGTSSGAGPKEKVDTLCNAPHLLFCHTQNGAMGCFVTFPKIEPSVASLFPAGVKLPLPSLAESLQLPLHSPPATVKGNKSKPSKKGKDKHIDAPAKQRGRKIADILSQILLSTKDANINKATLTADDSMTCEASSSGLGDKKVSEQSSMNHNNCKMSGNEEANVTVSPNSAYTHSIMSSNIEMSAQQDVSNNLLTTATSTATATYNPHSTDPHNKSRDNNPLSLDLDPESVQQLLQLSSNSLASGTTSVDTSHTSFSPLTEFMNTLALPIDKKSHNSSQNEAEMRGTSTGASWMNVTTTVNQSALNVPTTCTSSPDLPVNFNPLQPQPNLSTHPPHSYNTHNSFHSIPAATSAHKMLPQPGDHLPMNSFNHQGSFHHGQPLYSFTGAVGGETATNVFSPFPVSMLPAQEYQDLESLMNTIITDTDAQPQVPLTTNQQSVRMNPIASPTTGADFYTLDTNSTNSLRFSSASSDMSSGDPGLSYRLSLPDLSLDSSALRPVNTSDVEAWSQFLTNHASTQSTNARSSSCISNVSAPLQNIPEGLQMNLEEVPMMQQLDVCDYRTGVSSIPSSPGQASLSSQSSLSAQDVFEVGSPSVLELCEMLSESPNVQQYDFSHLTLSDSEQQQLFQAAKTIQSAFRKYKDRRQASRTKQKRAALMIEKYYKQYREAKQQQDHAARKIQQQYRDYRRSRDLNRAALFVQQMYRYHRIRSRRDHDRTNSSSFSEHSAYQ